VKVTSNDCSWGAILSAAKWLSRMKNTILFVSHKKAQCGVYEFGNTITDVLQNSKIFKFIRVECSSFLDLQTAISEYAPSCIVYNYYPSVLPWVATRIAPMLWKSNISSIDIPQLGIIHEITQHIADTATVYRRKYLLSRASHLSNSLFDFYIAADPTLLLLNPFVYKTGRLIPSYQNSFSVPPKPVIGSIGFATPQKGFEKVVQLVQREFDEAVIRFNIPAADYGDKYCVNAKAIAEKCKDLITKQGIQLTVTHDYLDNKTMMDFLAKNTVNVFLYEDKTGRGLSSAVDNAIAVQRPVAVSDGVMFRHVFDVEPSVCVTKNNLKTIIQNGFAPLRKHYNEWNSENLLWEYERILNSVISRWRHLSKPERDTARTLRSKCKRLLSRSDISFTWLRSSEKATEDDMTVCSSAQYTPIRIPENVSLNRILDNKARELYKPSISKLAELVPKAMAKKIPEANVQQAFVFDTVHRYLSQYRNPKLLCVGSYQDTASMCLIKMGLVVEEIDPMLNYSLQEYFTRPSTVKNSYDIIFSTSVIEHDPDDESFIKCVADLLAPGGVAVITCDYKDGWKPGEPKPAVDARLYTQHDLRDRLLPLMSDCRPVDEPQWDCPNPDFNYLGKYRYSFATFVVKKIS
jgi:SAM-dependent methyltransferase